MKVTVEVDLSEGMVFKYSNSFYIVSRTGCNNEFLLINMLNGRRYTNASSPEVLAEKLMKDKFKYIGLAEELRINIEKIFY